MAAFSTLYLLLEKRKILLQLLYLRRIPCKATKKKRILGKKNYVKRQTKGKYHLLVQGLKLYDQHDFFRCFFACHVKILKCCFPGLDPKLRRWLHYIHKRFRYTWTGKCGSKIVCHIKLLTGNWLMSS